MTTLRIPPESRGAWRGIFPSKEMGDFSESWNIDLERVPGKLSLSGRGEIMIRSDSDITFGPPKAILTSAADGTSRVYALAETKILTSASVTSGWGADTHGGSLPTKINDAITHGDTDISDTALSKDRILVSTDTSIGAFNDKNDVAQWNANWFTDSNGPISTQFDVSGATTPHLFGKIQQLVIVTDGDAFHTIDKNDVVVRRRIVFPPGMTAECVYTSKDRYWLGLKTTAGGDGLIISWDGSAENYTDYKFPGTPISGWVKNGVPYFINQYGQILSLNGYDFEEVKHFPIYEERLLLSTDSFYASETGIHRKGCVLDGDLVKILVAAPHTSRRMRSGVWIYDTKKDNLYHHQSISDYKSDTTVLIDYGQPILFRPGPLFSVAYSSATTRLIGGGGHYRSYNSSTQIALYKFNSNHLRSSLTARGYYVSPTIPAGEAQDFFQHFWLFFRTFVHADNKIVVKFRTAEPLTSPSSNVSDDPVQISSGVVWVSDTHFRMGSPFGLPAVVKVGHEVEVIAGRNAGCTFHITAINDTNGVALTPTDTTTADVSIDEAAPIGDTFLSFVRFDNWTKIETITDTSVSFHDFSIPGGDSDGNPISVGDFVQFKVELRGKMQEIDDQRVTRQDSFPTE